MVKLPPGEMFLLVCLKDRFWALCFFWIYMNDLANNLKCSVKLFADDTSLKDPPLLASQRRNYFLKLDLLLIPYMVFIIQKGLLS